jgi:hypothetical protein
MSHQVGDVPWPSGWQFYYSSSGKMPSALNMFGIKCSKTFSVIAFPMRGTKLRPPDAQTLPIQKTIGKALEHGYFMLQKSSLASAPDALSVAFRAGDRHAGIQHVVASALACPTRNEDKGLKWVHTLGDTFLQLLQHILYSCLSTLWPGIWDKLKLIWRQPVNEARHWRALDGRRKFKFPLRAQQTNQVETFT